MALTQTESLVLRGVRLGVAEQSGLKRFDSNGVMRTPATSAISGNPSPIYPDGNQLWAPSFRDSLEASARRAGRSGSARSVPAQRSLARSAQERVLSGQARWADRVGRPSRSRGVATEREPAAALAVTFASLDGQHWPQAASGKPPATQARCLLWTGAFTASTQGERLG